MTDELDMEYKGAMALLALLRSCHYLAVLWYLRGAFRADLAIACAPCLWSTSMMLRKASVV